MYHTLFVLGAGPKICSHTIFVLSVNRVSVNRESVNRGVSESCVRESWCQWIVVSVNRRGPNRNQCKIEISRPPINKTNFIIHNYDKRSGLQNLLSLTLNQSIDFRWDSKLIMLESIKKIILTCQLSTLA